MIACYNILYYSAREEVEDAAGCQRVVAAAACLAAC